MFYENKNITAIKYNQLNLPTEITFNGGTDYKITYIYNAVGEKVKKMVIANGVTRTTDYLYGYQYKQGILQFYPTSEGYVDVTKVGDTYTFNYVYHYKDQLGNIRLSYGLDPRTGLTRILEENGYYPYGLKHTNYNGDLKAYGKLSPNSIDVVLKGIPDGGAQELETIY